MADPALSQGAPCFAMAYLAGADCLVLEALRGGEIEPEDVATFWAVLQSITWRSGRCWAKPPELAAAMGCDLPGLEQSLGRLIAADLLVLATDYYDRGRRTFYCLHPLVIGSGGPYKRRSQWAQFWRDARNRDKLEAQAAAVDACRAVVRA